MSMSPDPERFQELRQLLVLKRYERPHPGYFENFSCRVFSRIRAGETGEEPSFWQRLVEESSAIQWLRERFDTSPVLAGAFGVAVCGLLAAGLFYSDTPPMAAVSNPFQSVDGMSAPDQATAPGVMIKYSSGPAVMPQNTSGSLFEEIKASRVPPVFRPSYQSISWPGN